MEFGDLKRRVQAWDRAGLSYDAIAQNLRLHETEVRDLARDQPQWEPSQEEIEQATAAIRAQWSEAEWERASRLSR